MTEHALFASLSFDGGLHWVLRSVHAAIWVDHSEIIEDEQVFTVALVRVEVGITELNFQVCKHGFLHFLCLVRGLPSGRVGLHPVKYDLAVIPASRVSHVVIESTVYEEKSRFIQILCSRFFRSVRIVTEITRNHEICNAADFISQFGQYLTSKNFILEASDSKTFFHVAARRFTDGDR